MLCPICESEYRHQIDLMLMQGEPLEIILSKFNSTGSRKLTIDQLKIHAVCHLKKNDSDKESIATKLAFREADALNISCNEYMATQQRLGSVISKQLTMVESGEAPISTALSKSLVDLYLGTGNQIRETVKLLTETYADMNADESKQGSRSGLAMLSEALDRSRQQAVS